MGLAGWRQAPAMPLALLEMLSSVSEVIGDALSRRLGRRQEAGMLQMPCHFDVILILFMI